MLGCRPGFQSYVKAVSPNVTYVHCFIPRFALCTKVLPAQLLACLKQVVKIKNFVKASALNTRLFKQLCEDLGSKHTKIYQPPLSHLCTIFDVLSVNLLNRVSIFWWTTNKVKNHIKLFWVFGLYC